MLFSLDWKRYMIISAVAGALWGVFSFGVNTLTGIFPFEHSRLYNMFVFAVAGSVFGVTSGGFLLAAKGVLPFNRPFPKAIMVSTGLWLVLRLAGALLSGMESERYHVATLETLQGLALSLTLGSFIGLSFEMFSLERGEM
ncbi:MAG: hypothetical protein HY887_04885 [Deltaproteobacteria bacterium]|nr:hypothetical protein [Deltaproteobacteria bacterium]